MGVSILYPKYMKKLGSELTGKFLQNEFLRLQIIFLTSESETIYKILKNPLSFAPKALWSVPNKPNPSFYSIFHAKTRSKFPPVWPVPIETPQPSLQGLIHPYWLSTHLTQAILTYHISIHHTFLSGIASPYTKPIFSILGIILPYRFFSHPTY